MAGNNLFFCNITFVCQLSMSSCSWTHHAIRNIMDIQRYIHQVLVLLNSYNEIQDLYVEMKITQYWKQGTAKHGTCIH